MNTNTNKWNVIGRGLNGWHAKAPNVRGSGGTFESYLSQAVDGALIYDASEADVGAFTKLVLSGPMVDPSLAPNEVDRFGKRDRETALAMAPMLAGCYQAYALAAGTDREFSGLDTVGVGIFEALLRTVPGIKIGRVLYGQATWEG